MMKTKRYAVQGGIGCVGLMVTFSPFLFRIPFNLQVEAQKNEQYAQTQIEADAIAERERLKHTRLALRRKTSEKMQENGEVLADYSTLRITDYRFDPKKKPKVDTTLYQKGELVQVTDKNRVCIGVIRDGEFLFKPHYREDICKPETN